MFNNKLFLFVLSFISVFSSCNKNPSGSEETASATDVKLEYMQVVEQVLGARLYLYGNFGDSNSQSKVFINGKSAVNGELTNYNKIESWKPYLIILTIGEPESETGHGNVMVENRGKQSNKRMLNVWKGNLVYAFPSGGTLEQQVRFEVILRGDNQSYNTSAVRPLNLPSSFCSSSNAYYAIGGTGTSHYTDGTCDDGSVRSVDMQVTWESRTGSIAWKVPGYDNTNDEDNFQSTVALSSAGFRITDLSVHKRFASKTTTTSLACGYRSPGTPIDMDFTDLPDELKDFVLTFKPNSSVIQAGSVQATGLSNIAGLVYNAPAPTYTARLSWNDISPLY